MTTTTDTTLEILKQDRKGRVESIFKNRNGVYLPRASMSRGMGLCADWLKPIYEIIRTGDGRRICAGG